MQRVSDDPDELRASLDTARRQLAEALESREPLAEELAQERFRREVLEDQARKLASVLVDHLLQPSAPQGRVSRLRGAITRYRRARSDEWRQVDLLQSSDLFSDAWYLMHYPAAFEAGIPPALHYLREGADRGYDPSKHFTTNVYLHDHPDVRKSGVNPLVHFLESHRKATTRDP